MTDATRQKKPASNMGLKGDDLRVVLEPFGSPAVNYRDLGAMIAARFHADPILLAMCTSFVFDMERLEAGKEPLLNVQRLLAKSILSLIVNTGRIDFASRYLESCIQKWGDNGLAELQSILSLAGSDTKHVQVLDKPWLDYQVYDRKADTTLVLMCGNTHRFSVELNAVIPWLQPLPVNLIYLRDFNLSLYLAGIRSLGGLEVTIARLRKDIAAMGSRRTVTLGNSAGAYGALNFANLLDAKQVVCFAGPTSLHTGMLEAADRPSYANVEKMIADGKLTEPDLRSAYESNEIQVRYFYGADNAFDTAQAETLKGVRNFVREPLMGWSRHVVIGELARRGLLHDIFAKTLV